jgi:hypothetical protein
MTDAGKSKWPGSGPRDMGLDKHGAPGAAAPFVRPGSEFRGGWPGQLSAQSSRTIPHFGDHHGAPVRIVDDRLPNRRDTDGAKCPTRGVQDRRCNTKDPGVELGVIKRIPLLLADGQQLGFKPPWIHDGFRRMALQSDRRQKLTTHRFGSISQQDLTHGGRVQVGFHTGAMPDCDRTVGGDRVDKGYRIPCEHSQVGALPRPGGKRFQAGPGKVETVQLVAARGDPGDHAAPDAACLRNGIARNEPLGHEGRQNAERQGFVEIPMNGEIRQSRRSIVINHMSQRPEPAAKRQSKPSRIAVGRLGDVPVKGVGVNLGPVHGTPLPCDLVPAKIPTRASTVPTNKRWSRVFLFQNRDLWFLNWPDDNKRHIRAELTLSRRSFKGE